MEESELLLNVVIPVSDFKNRMTFFDSWIQDIEDYPIQLVLIHDTPDEQVHSLFLSYFTSFNSKKLILKKVNFKSPGLSRNFGLKFVSAKYVAFWDSDDVPHLDTVFQAIQELPEDFDIIVGQYRSYPFNQVTPIIKASKDGDISDIFAKPPGMWRMIFKTTSINNLKFEDYQMGEDQLFISSIDWTEMRVSFTSFIFYDYITHDKSRLTGEYGNILDLIKVLKDVAALFKIQKNMSKFLAMVLLRLSFFSITKLTIVNKLKVVKILFLVLLNPKVWKDLFFSLFTLLQARKAI